MLFLTYETSHYEILQEKLFNNGMIPSSISQDSYNDILVKRSQELGFKDLNSYSRYVLLLPFREHLDELKKIVQTHTPPCLFQNKTQLDSINEDFLIRTLGSRLSAESQVSETLSNGGSWFTKVLTKKIEFKKIEGKVPLKVSVFESGQGEEPYSITMKLLEVLPKNVQLDITAHESNREELKLARIGIFKYDKLNQLSEYFKSKYFTVEERGGRSSPDLKNIIKLNSFDIINEDFDDTEMGTHDLIFCNNIIRFYPPNLAKAIIKKLSRLLSDRGSLFANFPKVSDYPSFEHLNLNALGQTYNYTLKKKLLGCEEKMVITPQQDSIDNKILGIKVLILENKPDEAMKQVDILLRDHIDSISANFLKGDIYALKQEHKKAIFQYAKVTLIDKNFLPALFNIASLHWLLEEKEEASKKLEETMRKLDDFDVSKLKPMFNIGFAGFVNQCTELKKMISSDESLSLEDLIAGARQTQESVNKVPDIIVPDPFAKEESKPQVQTPAGNPETQEKKVVIIAELPSTRDYGEHDPWKQKQKKLQVEAEKSTETAILDLVEPIVPAPPSPPQKEDLKKVLLLKPDAQKPSIQEPEEEGLVYRIPRDYGTGGEEEEEPIEKKKKKIKKKPKKTASPRPSKSKKPKSRKEVEEEERGTTLYVRPVHPDSLDGDSMFADDEEEEDDEEYEEEEYEEEEEEEYEEDERKTRTIKKFSPSLDSRIGKLQLKLKNTQLFNSLKETISPVVEKQVTLPANLLHQMEVFILKEDVEGIIKTINSYRDPLTTQQYEVLHLITRICQIKDKGVSAGGTKRLYKGKLGDIQRDIERINKLLDKMNLLEASILFQNVIQSRPGIASLSPHQRKRLDNFKQVLDRKMERYQNFIDTYFTDPKEVFQENIWKILARLTPPQLLVETGKKYGLDPEKMPKNLI